MCGNIYYRFQNVTEPCSALIVTCTCNAAQASQPHFSCTKKYDPEKKFVYFLLDHVWAQQHDADIGLAWNELCYFECLQWSFMFSCSDLGWYMYLTHNESKSRRQWQWWLSVRLWSPLPFSLQHLSLGGHGVDQGVILISSHCVRNISKERMFTIKRWLW